MAEVRRAGTRNWSWCLFSRRDGCLGPSPAAMAAGSRKRSFGLLLSISTAPRTDVLGPSLGLLPAALGPRGSASRRPGGRASSSRGRRARPARCVHKGRPLGPQARGGTARARGFRGKAGFRVPRVSAPQAQELLRPEPLRGHGPSSLGVDPARALCPLLGRPVTPSPPGMVWALRGRAPALLLSLCLPGAPACGPQHLLLGGGSSSTPTRIPASLHTGPLCPCVPRRPGGWPRNVQDRSAGRDFLDGGEAAGGSVMPPHVSGTEGRVRAWASLLTCPVT